jgi:predicted AlkP superfamily phosphohydrolase/phosphomutase
VLKGLDEAVGTMIELADRRGAMILVVSDHGFGPCLGRVHVNRILIDAGVARLPGLAGKLRRRVSQARDSLRLSLLKRLDPEARSSSFDTSVVAQFPFDWDRTVAFAPHQDTAAMIYLNTTDRRAGAPLRTPRQIDDAREAASQALKAACHPETGVPLFPQVIATAEAYNLDPAREGFPELIAMPDENYWVRTKLSKGKTWIEPDLNLPGTHRPEGIVAIAGPGIPAGRTLKASLCDIAPTIYRLFGLPVPPHVEGKPLDVVSPGETLRQDSPSTLFNGPHQPPNFDYTPEEQAIIDQRLADLGYE